MAILSVHLFGHFQVHIANHPVNGFKSDKARALFAFLIVEPNHPHPRSMLAGWLWPDLGEEAANSNLRSVLSNLRKIFARSAPDLPPILLTDYHSIQFNPQIEIECDLLEFRSQMAMGDLVQAARLYSGHLLEGFSIGSEPFDDWLRMRAGAAHQEMLQALHTLAAECIYRGEFDQAMDYAHHHLELEPASEEAYQQVIYLLGLTGQRSAALAQFKQCKLMLRKELSVEPSSSTLKLIKAIREGEPITRAVIPPSLRITVQSHPLQLVAREKELDWLESRLNAALASQGSAIFITGDAGSGKTSLLDNMMIRAFNTHPRLLALKGSCAIQDGAGAPYLPFREILLMLTRPGELDWGRSPLDLQASYRIQEARQHILRLLGEQAPDLNLFQQKRSAPVEKSPENGLFERVMQHGSLFEQFAIFLQTLANDFPLVLAIDNLQWADQESLYLFQYLARKLPGNCILLIGVYRSEEMIIEDSGKRLSLETLVNELKFSGGNILLDLNQSDGEAFTAAYLNRLANRFDVAFRKALYQYTGGHALFISEIVEELQNHGDLYQDSAGFWANRPKLNWSRLPARVEAAAAERISRLPAFWKSALMAASIEGEQFTAEVLALTTGSKDQAMIQGLSRVVWRQHGLVVPQGTRVSGDQHISHYRFRHSIFQQYLYQQMDDAERMVLHEAVGNALEQIYKHDEHELGMQASALALHYSRARNDSKALTYDALAGETAYGLSAMHDAARHFTSALELLERLPPHENRRRMELNILRRLNDIYLVLYGWGSPEQEHCLERMHKIAQKTGSITDQLWAISQAAHSSMGQNQYAQAQEQGEELLRLAEANGKTEFKITARILQGQGLILRGRLKEGRTHLEQALKQIECCSAAVHDNDIYSDGRTARVYLSMALQYQGFIDQARACVAAVITDMRNDPSLTLLGFGLAGGGITSNIILGDVEAAGRWIDDLADLVEKGEYVLYQPWVLIGSGWRAARQGRPEMGLQKIREGLQACGGKLAHMGHPFLFATAAETLAQFGCAAEGEKLLDQVLSAFASSFKTNAMSPYFLCIQGEIQRNQGDMAGSAHSFAQAVRDAQEQGARLWELMAATGLCRLELASGSGADNCRLLGALYDSFQEGLDSAPLLAARSVLEQALGRSRPGSHRTDNLPL